MCGIGLGINLGIDVIKEEIRKVFFRIPKENQNGFEGEWLWCRHFSKETCEIDNSPFRIYGISIGDIISYVKEGDNLIFSSLVKRGGHSTYRVILPAAKGHDYFLRYWDDMAKFGCTYEGAEGDRRIYSIDIPNISNVSAAYSTLQKYEDLGVWEFEEAHYAG
jgi:Domain of unknown function (DUF4265)